MALIPEDNLNETGHEIFPGGNRPAPAPSYVPGTRFAERYEIIKPLGRSAFGVAYQAADLENSRLVTLKVFRHELMTSAREKQRFERFLKLTQDLEHPHIVRILHYGQWNEAYYLVREYI